MGSVGVGVSKETRENLNKVHIPLEFYITNKTNINLTLFY